MAKLKPLRKPEDLAAVPVDEPVLVELEPVASGEIQEPDDKTKAPDLADQGDDGEGVKTLKEQLAALQEASKRQDENLSKQRDETRKAQERADALDREAKQAKGRVSDTEGELIANSLSSAQAEQASAKIALKAAFEAGDADGLAEAQSRIARAAADIREYERATAILADRKELEKAQPQQQQAPRYNSVAEAIDARTDLMDKERAWLKEHQDVWVDPARNQELGVAYNRAIKEGHPRGSDGYFKYLEQFMGYSKPDRAEQEDEGTTIVAAPVSRDNRSSANGQQISGNRIMLTPEQRDFARTMGLTDIQYAQQVAALNAAKKADPDKYSGRA